MSPPDDDPAAEQRVSASVSGPLVQPDQRSCGAACLVVARGLAEPAYGRALRDPGHWRAEVLRTHAEVTGLRDGGRVGLPWPRALGTPPWSVARRLGVTTGRRWRTSRCDLAAVAAAVRAGDAVPLFVGSRLLPRHVLLAVEDGPDGLRVYDPARGTVRPLADALRTGWPRPWWAVRPVVISSRGPRTPA